MKVRSTVECYSQPAYYDQASGIMTSIVAWKTHEGTATAHSDFEYVDWAPHSNNDLAAACALPRAEVLTRTLPAQLAVFATVRSGAARRNQEI